MRDDRLKIITRITLWLCGICLAAVLYFPMWRIDLDAPQYPEGLSLKIHASDIKGDVAIINGLNHYIGMRTLHKEDFPEFQILPYCIIFFVLLFVVAGFANRKRWLYSSFLLFVVFGIVAMADFWRWEYNYGHNLDPNAAIIVPGMAYQPPLIGFKQLLNFGAYSIPDIGGWIFVACGGLLLLAVIFEWRRGIKIKKSLPATATLLFAAYTLSGCSVGPQPIRVGKDACAYCKMTIADARFGAELVTSTGRNYKFDDIDCMFSFIKTLETIAAEQAAKYVTDYCGQHELVEVNKCVLLKNSEIQCPMQGHLVAFSSPDSLIAVKAVHKGEEAKWGIAQ